MKTEIITFLKVWRYFGFGPIRQDEVIGRFSIHEVVDKSILRMDDKGIGEVPSRTYVLIDSSYSKHNLVRSRGGCLYNLLDNFKTRCDIRENRLGQPYLEDR